MVKLVPIHTGNFKLDGGAMFGVVPKSMWKKINAPDDNNMCTWAMRCLLVDEGDRKILIDTGMGNKISDKMKSHFYPHGDTDLNQSLGAAGYRPEDITDVLLTHFHFDHVGGALDFDQDKNIIPAFPNATYWTNDAHYKWAIEPNPRERASFLKENFVPLKDRGILKMLDVEENIQFSPSIRLHFMYGHTEAMMIPIITDSEGKQIAFCADLLPSAGHIGKPYVMSYDIRPLQTMKEKAIFFDYLYEENISCFLEHDKDYECLSLTKDERGRYKATNLGSLSQWSTLS